MQAKKLQFKATMEGELEETKSEKAWGRAGSRRELRTTREVDGGSCEGVVSTAVQLVGPVKEDEGWTWTYTECRNKMQKDAIRISRE